MCGSGPGFGSLLRFRFRFLLPLPLRPSAFGPRYGTEKAAKRGSCGIAGSSGGYGRLSETFWEIASLLPPGFPQPLLQRGHQGNFPRECLTLDREYSPGLRIPDGDFTPTRNSGDLATKNAFCHPLFFTSKQTAFFLSPAPAAHGADPVQSKGATYPGFAGMKSGSLKAGMSEYGSGEKITEA